MVSQAAIKGRDGDTVCMRILQPGRSDTDDILVHLEPSTAGLLYVQILLLFLPRPLRPLGPHSSPPTPTGKLKLTTWWLPAWSHHMQMTRDAYNTYREPKKRNQIMSFSLGGGPSRMTDGHDLSLERPRSPRKSPSVRARESGSSAGGPHSPAQNSTPPLTPSLHNGTGNQGSSSVKNLGNPTT